MEEEEDEADEREEIKEDDAEQEEREEKERKVGRLWSLIVRGRMKRGEREEGIAEVAFGSSSPGTI